MSPVAWRETSWSLASTWWVPTKLIAGARRAVREKEVSPHLTPCRWPVATLREERLPVADLDGPERESFRLLADHREDLVNERTRAQNRLRWHLHSSTPPWSWPWVPSTNTLVLDRIALLLESHQGPVAQIAAELVVRIRSLTIAVRDLERQVTTMVRHLAPSLMALHGCGALTAAKILGETADVSRLLGPSPLCPLQWHCPDSGLVGAIATSPTPPGRELPSQHGDPPHCRYPAARWPGKDARRRIARGNAQAPRPSVLFAVEFRPGLPARGGPASQKINVQRCLPEAQIGASLQVDDLGVVDEAVDHGRGDDGVAEDLAPAAEGLVRGHDDAGPLVAGRDQLEEQVGGFAVEGDVADLVDDEERDAPEPAQLVVEPCRRRGPRRGGSTHSAAVAKATRCPARQARMPSAIARWVLPVPGGPKKTTLSLASMKSRVPRWATTSRGRSLVLEVEVLDRLAGREPGGADADLAAVGLAGSHLAFQAGGQELLVAPGLGSGPLGQAFDRARPARGP